MGPTPHLLVLVYAAVALFGILASVGIALLWSPLATRRWPWLQGPAHQRGDPESETISR